ncbi:MAG: hypothetical protein ACRBCI_03200 [Cellvibrionaceae bacterium]
MKYEYPFESILVRNRLGQGMTLLVCPFSLSSNNVCVLVKAADDMHESVLAKNAEYIVLQLRERFSRTVKNFSMVELRENDEGNEVWYGWQFNWVGNTPLESKCQPLSSQQQQYYRNVILGYEAVSNSG